jgi:SNF2 family DNA or RNA helicase
MRSQQHCPVCQKVLEVVSSTTIGEEILNTYKCGHSFAASALLPAVRDGILTHGEAAGYELRPYQVDGVKFIIDSDYNCIIGDQMRLGKTPQALMALKNKYNEKTPCLIIVRGANLWQWTREYKTWVDASMLGIWPIVGSKGLIPPGFRTYIISMDTIGRAGMLERLNEIDFKLIIADEAHSFKNDDSLRSRALVNFLNQKNVVEVMEYLQYKCPVCLHCWDVEEKYTITNGVETHVERRTQQCEKCGTLIRVATQRGRPTTTRKCSIVLLTGTAIKNRASEYFIPLNLVAPTVFPSRKRFQDAYLQQNDKGQWDRIKRWRYEEFKTVIYPYVLRREKEDVYTDLPAINRMFTLIEPNKGALTNQYNRILDKMDAKLAERSNPSYWDMAEDLMALRKICGLMKVMWTADYVESSMLDSPTDVNGKPTNGRMAIGIHHHDVRDILKFKLSHIGCLTLSGEDSSERKDWIMRNFATSPERILILNMLAGGVGMDFHYCHNVLILERQWSFADEQQFEFRFYNPDPLISKGIPTSVEYIIAKGTLDEWWYNMIEGKKVIQGETIGTQWDLKNQPAFFHQLIEETVFHRL